MAPVIIYYVWNMLTYVCASAEDRGGHHSQPYSLEIGPFSKPAARLGWRPESPASLWFLTPQRWRPLVGVSHAQVFLIVFPGFLFVLQWVLGIRTQVLMVAQQALLPPESPPRPKARI